MSRDHPFLRSLSSSRTITSALVLQVTMREARRRFTEGKPWVLEVVDRAKNYDAAHPSSWVPPSRGMSNRRRRCQRAGDAHARTHAHIVAHTHIAHTFFRKYDTLNRSSVLEASKLVLPRKKNVRAIGWGLLKRIKGTMSLEGAPFRKRWTGEHGFNCVG